MNLKQTFDAYKAILVEKVVGSEEKDSFIEVVMVLLIGILWGLYNPNQVAQQLEISPKQLYEDRAYARDEKSL